MNLVLSRISRKIKDVVGKSLVDFYSIKGERGERKSIKLDRELGDDLYHYFLINYPIKMDSISIAKNHYDPKIA
jgi:hypothetical protein